MDESGSGASDASSSAASEVGTDVIEVLCVVCPDGRTLWTDRAEHAHIESLIRAWRESLPDDKRERYLAGGVNCGGVILRMLRDDYLHAIPATNTIRWPA